jgi:hypothetical protein
VLLPQAERVLGERLGELGARLMKRRLAMPLTTLVLPALALVAGIALFRHVRRYA